MKKKVVAAVFVVVFAVSLLGASAQAQRRMTIPDAKYYIGKALTDDWGQAWKSRERTVWRRCKNVSSIRVSCWVGWLNGNYVYSGKVLAYYHQNDKKYVYTQTQRVKRQHTQ